MSTLTLNRPIKKALGKLSTLEEFDKEKDILKFLLSHDDNTSQGYAITKNTFISMNYSKKQKGYYNSLPLNNPQIINHWTRYNGESWTTVFIISATSKHHAGVIASQYINIDGHSFNSPYDCTGKPFTYQAEYIKLDSNKWAITQRGSIDV